MFQHALLRQLAGQPDAVLGLRDAVRRLLPMVVQPA